MTKSIKATALPPIKTFCATGTGGKYSTRTTWVQNGYRYATNGYLIVREPCDSQDSIGDKRPNGEALYAVADFSRCTKPLVLSGRTITSECDVCKGHGKLPNDCPLCCGSGKCVCSKCCESHKCDKCKGRGVLYVGRKCMSCKGRVYVDVAANQRIGGRLFSGAALAKILTLSGVLIDTGKRGRLDPLLFVANGNRQGILMPLDEEWLMWAVCQGASDEV